MVKNPDPGKEQRIMKVKTKAAAGLTAVLAVLVLGKLGAADHYTEQLNTAVYIMLEGAAKSESEAKLFRDVWHNTIYKEDSLITDRYTKNAQGDFYEDYRTSLEVLKTDEHYLYEIAEIEKNRDIVDDLIKDLEKPPIRYKKAHDAIMAYYEAYLELVELATEPAGDLTSYSEHLDKAIARVTDDYKAMQFYLE